MTISLHRALLAIVAIAILTGLIPAALALDRRLAAALEKRVRDDLMMARGILVDRNAAGSDAMMMRAKDLGHTPGLASAISRGDQITAKRLLSAALGPVAAEPILVGGDERVWMGRGVRDSLIAATRKGAVPVDFVSDGRTVARIALAPVEVSGRWIGAAGLLTPVDEGAAAALASLTHSNVVIVTIAGAVAATTLADSAAAIELAGVSRTSSDGSVRDMRVRRDRYLVAAVPLGRVGSVVFARDLETELAALPSVRRVAALSAVVALGIALVLGAILATFVARPVRQLSVAADRMANSDFDVTLPRSALREVAHVTRALDAMRRALATRLADLQTANTALKDRTQRLTVLQSELMQRDRLAATGRLVTQLAHEVRNPIANLRNLIELLRRRLDGDDEGREYAQLAIEELHRMHRLSEQLLDLNRPRGPGVRRADPVTVAREVVALVSAGRAGRAGPDATILVEGEAGQLAAITPDALKQVLLNVVQNALEAAGLTRADAGAQEIRIVIDVARAAGSVVIEVRDDGPGIPPEILSRIFDPFFTTKEAMNGVGLGLFVAEGLIRTAGGRISAANNARAGARVRIELPVATDGALAVEVTV